MGLKCPQCTAHAQTMQKVWRGLLPFLRAKMKAFRKAKDRRNAERYRLLYNHYVGRIKNPIQDPCKWKEKTS